MAHFLKNIFFIFFTSTIVFVNYSFALPPPPPLPSAPFPTMPVSGPPVQTAPVAGQQICLPSPFEKIASLAEFIKEILGVIIKVGLPVAAVLLIWAGLLFVTSQGNEQQLAKAKKAFLWVVIGIAVLFGSWLLATAIEGTIRSIGAGGNTAGGGAATCQAPSVR